MPRRCFIAAPGEANLTTIVAVLEARGWDTFALADVAKLGSSLIEALTDAIGSADIVVALLDDDSHARNTIFEIGLAAGLEKPVLILISDEATVPSDLQSFLRVRASVDNSAAIALALDNLERYAAELAVGHEGRQSVGQPLGSYADQLLEEARSGASAPTHDLESVVVRAIEASGAVASRGAGSDRAFDIGVWSDDLDAIGANPLLVELKRRIDSQSVRQSLLALHQVPGARAALIVSLEEPGKGEAKWLRWPVLGVSLEMLLKEMRSRSFAEIVRDLRNRSVHDRRL